MPPKRKRAAAETATTTTSTRATRSSARNGDAAVSDTASTAPAVDEDVPTEDPKPKRSRKAAAKSTKATTAKNTAPKSQPTRAEGGGSSGNSANTSVVSTAKPPKAVKPVKNSVSEPEPYSAADANALFGKYADEDDPEVIGPAGLEKLCGDADIPLEGPLPLLMAWQFRASEMAKVTKSEWESGTSALQISSLSALSIALHDLHDLLILNKPALKPPTTAATAPKKKTAEPYNRTRYYQYAKDKSKAFNEFYMFCFMLVKPPQGRNIEMEVASAFWTVLLVPQYELMQEILEFIAEKGTYKGVNKDLWQMVLEFCQTVSPSLENFEADGAWPTMLDEFVAWKKAK